MPIKAYKGFHKDMTCRGFQFDEGKSYEESEAKLCESGFHACLNPIDCFRYYLPSESEFHEVELDDVSDERKDDTKVCAKKIKIGAKLDIAGIVKLAFDYVKLNCTNENNAEKGKAASAGYRGAASAGESGAASAGASGAASAGYCGAAVSRGTASTDKNGLSVVRGNGCKAKGGLGSIIVIANENDDDYNITEWKVGVIDGETLKPDVWYKLENGEFVECDEA